MSKYLLLSAMFLVSCSSCKNSPAPCDAGTESCTFVPPPVPAETPQGAPETPPFPKSNLLTGDHWSIVIPDGWTKKDIANPDPILKASFTDANDDLLLLVEEDVPADTTTDVYALMAVRGAKEAGATFDSQSTDRDFNVISMHRDDVNVYFWVKTLNGQGYALSCGGSNLKKDVCANIATTFLVK